jgi:photosystem II stability/assembly factor-like uncharacterized protein
LQAQNNWEKIELPDSLNFSQVYCLDENTVFAFSTSGYPLFVDAIYKTSDGGENWKILLEVTNKSKKTFPEKMSFINQNIGFVVMGDTLYKTTDAGNTWVTIGRIQKHYNGGDIIRLLAIDEENIWIIMSDRELLASTDGGKNFYYLAGYCCNPFFFEIGYSNGVVYAITPLEDNVTLSNVYITTDKGKTWDFVPGGLFPNEISYIYYSPLNDLCLHSPTSATFGGVNNLVVTEDGFKTVSMIPYPENIQSINGRKIVFIDKSRGVLLNKGVYYTEQGGKVWMQEYELDDKEILDIDGKDDTWYAIARKHVYKTKKEVGIDNSVKEAIKVFPNPATVSFRIESTEKQVTQVDIYDIVGRVVLTQDFPAQNMVDIKHLTNGIYFAKIYIEKQVYQTKIVKQ